MFFLFVGAFSCLEVLFLFGGVFLVWNVFFFLFGGVFLVWDVFFPLFGMYFFSLFGMYFFSLFGGVPSRKPHPSLEIPTKSQDLPLLCSTWNADSV